MRRVLGLLPVAQPSGGVRVESVDLPTGGGVRVFTPPGGGNGAALVSMHGGGMVIGSASMDDSESVRTALDLDIVVVSVDYRLAPEHPFPAAHEDCFAAWRWLQRGARERGVDSGRVAVSGVSAGGGLAASLVHRIHDEGGVPAAGQLLFSPMLDDRTAARRELDGAKHILWGNRANRIGWRSYLGMEPGGADVPEYAVAARREDLSGLAPAWIGTGDIELFHAENRAYAEALEAAGVDCTLDVVPGAPHSFESAAGKAPVVQEYRRRAFGWLRERLSVAN